MLTLDTFNLLKHRRVADVTKIITSRFNLLDNMHQNQPRCACIYAKVRRYMDSPIYTQMKPSTVMIFQCPPSMCQAPSILHTEKA